MGTTDIPKKHSDLGTGDTEYIESLPTFLSKNKYNIHSMRKVNVVQTLEEVEMPQNEFYDRVTDPDRTMMNKDRDRERVFTGRSINTNQAKNERNNEFEMADMSDPLLSFTRHGWKLKN